MIFITSLRKITLNKQFIIIILIYLRVVQKVREQSCFGLFKWVLYQNGCHKIPNQIRVDLNIFHKIKLKLEWSRSRKVRMTQCENRPNFLIEFFNLNTYSFTKTCRKTIMFNWNIVSCVRHLKPFSNEWRIFGRYHGTVKTPEKATSLDPNEQSVINNSVSTWLKHR